MAQDEIRALEQRLAALRARRDRLRSAGTGGDEMRQVVGELDDVESRLAGLRTPSADAAGGDFGKSSLVAEQREIEQEIGALEDAERHGDPIDRDRLEQLRQRDRELDVAILATDDQVAIEAHLARDRAQENANPRLASLVNEAREVEVTINRMEAAGAAELPSGVAELEPLYRRKEELHTQIAAWREWDDLHRAEQKAWVDHLSVADEAEPSEQGVADPQPAAPAAGPGDPALDTGHYDDGHAFGWKGPPDESVDTGHYDDGHAFGWKSKDPPDEHQQMTPAPPSEYRYVQPDETLDPAEGGQPRKLILIGGGIALVGALAVVGAVILLGGNGSKKTAAPAAPVALKQKTPGQKHATPQPKHKAAASPIPVLLHTKTTPKPCGNGTAATTMDWTWTLQRSGYGGQTAIVDATGPGLAGAHRLPVTGRTVHLAYTSQCLSSAHWTVDLTKVGATPARFAGAD